MGDTSRKFDYSILKPDDHARFRALLGGQYRQPDLVIAPDGVAYLYRWHVIPHNPWKNIYLHVQVRSDPERPLHDHPWDNTSEILSGGYEEITAYRRNAAGPNGPITKLSYPCHHFRKRGDIVHRLAHWAHRLLLPDGVDYTMTLFITGQRTREWGFWLSDTEWVSHKNLIETKDGITVQKEKTDAHQ